MKVKVYQTLDIDCPDCGWLMDVNRISRGVRCLNLECSNYGKEYKLPFIEVELEEAEKEPK